MADRTRYLLAYDIRHARRLRRVHRVATDYGEPLQYSLFVCDLTAVELAHLKAALLDVVKQSEDSIGLFDLGPPAARGVQCVEFIGQRKPLPSGEAPVW